MITGGKVRVRRRNTPAAPRPAARPEMLRIEKNRFISDLHSFTLRVHSRSRAVTLLHIRFAYTILDSNMVSISGTDNPFDVVFGCVSTVTTLPRHPDPLGPVPDPQTPPGPPIFSI